jgi:eukaryotic-like serine/threonine-protein kinase
VQLFARAEEKASRIERAGVECTTPLALLARAAIQAERGDLTATLRSLDHAEAGFAGESMMAHWAAARRRRGQIVGGDTGRTLIAEAETYLGQHGVRDMPAVCRLLAPGFSDRD